MRPVPASENDGDWRSGGSASCIRATNFGQQPDLAVEGEERFGLTRSGPLSELRRRPNGVAPQRQSLPVRRRGEGHDVGLDRLESMRSKPQLRDDVGTQVPGESEAMGCLGCKRAADTVAALEDDPLQPGLR